MRERYEKMGRSIRLERARDTVRVIESAERGTAESGGTTFLARSHPPDAREVRAPRRRDVESIAERVASVLPAEISLERLTIIAGTTSHRCRFGGIAREWRERSTRVHVSLANVRRGVRAWLDLGGNGPMQVSFDSIAAAARALAHVTPQRKARHCTLLRLAPPVAAALWPAMLVHTAFASRASRARNIRISQHPPVTDARDGVGQEIHRASLVENGSLIDAWPNIYRPSYRFPPRPAPMHVMAAVRASDHADEASVAVALVAPFEARGEGLCATLLVDDGQGQACAWHAEMPVDQWLTRIVAIAGRGTWFPVGAGSWGAETVIEDIALQPASTRRRR